MGMTLIAFVEVLMVSEDYPLDEGETHEYRDNSFGTPLQITDYMKGNVILVHGDKDRHYDVFFTGIKTTNQDGKVCEMVKITRRPDSCQCFQPFIMDASEGGFKIQPPRQNCNCKENQ